MLLMFIAVLVTLVIYYLVKIKYEYWERRAVPGPCPKPIIGNLGQSFFFRKNIGEIYTKIYRQYPEERFVGIYRALTPALLIRDPEIIKNIFITAFNHFHDNDIGIDKKNNPLIGRSPFVLKGEEWKTVRSQLTPGFSSGKVKWIYPLIQENEAKLVKYMEKLKECETKDLSSKFTLSNVASCAFGIDGECFEDKSEFRELCDSIFSSDGWTMLGFLVSIVFPVIFKLIKVRLTPEHVEKYILQLVSRTVKYREDNNVTGNDYLQLLIDLKKDSKSYEFSDVDVAAHAAGFLADGSESSSTVMSFVLYYLSCHPEIQTRLRTEIDQALKEHDNQLPYEAFQQLPYLDAVINETLRIMPPVFFMQKVCTKNYIDPEKKLAIDKGTPIILPMHAIHNDPKYFEDPDTFNPERFIGSNGADVKKFTFFPFGDGPRVCLGKRFALLQVRAGIAKIVHHFELTESKKTQAPLKIDPTNLLITPIGGLWMNITKLN